jgi:hypothetical protein
MAAPFLPDIVGETYLRYMDNVDRESTQGCIATTEKGCDVIRQAMKAELVIALETVIRPVVIDNEPRQEGQPEKP